MDKKFTKKDWTRVVEYGKKFGSFPAVNTLDNKATIAIVYGATEEEATANAQLISCSPEMFDLLQRILANWKADEDVWSVTQEEIESLLTKATTI